MPQMMPMNWIMLFLFFISVFLTFNVMNFYLFNYNYSDLKIKSLNKNPLNWKW
uniref:ATP synthase F0 subunit 8 n=1 Tax=Himalopsyche malenanda TaxID=2598966 RepID=UPI0022DCE043|nr:ATP synthase F0 subunit 8 [Himalopsyche malenanda]UZZ44003.1 ATP synthase F0 subunit 8 [Himalopsyche malenanda]